MHRMHRMISDAGERHYSNIPMDRVWYVYYSMAIFYMNAYQIGVVDLRRGRYKAMKYEEKRKWSEQRQQPQFTHSASGTYSTCLWFRHCITCTVYRRKKLSYYMYVAHHIFHWGNGMPLHVSMYMRRNLFKMTIQYMHRRLYLYMRRNNCRRKVLYACDANRHTKVFFAGLHVVIYLAV